MRIAYILNSLGVGGAERQALGIAGRMARRGHAVAILTLRGQLAEEWETGLAVHRLEMRRTPLSFAAKLFPARRFLRQFRPDVIHSHSFHANLFARLLGVRLPRAAVVSTVHNVYERGWGRMTACRLTDGLATRTAFVSQAAADRYLQIKAASAQKCVVIPNAIDLSGLIPDAARRDATRAAMSITAEFVWLAAGRIAPAKDYPNLLAGFAQAGEAKAKAQLWIAGEGSAADVAALRELAKKLGLEAAVRFLGLRRDLPALLDAADGFVLASAWEGMPLALAEAMAMAKAVVATDVGGVRELVGETGAIVPPRDSAALAAAMLRVMQQPAEARQRQGRAARGRIVQKFDMERSAGEWEALYEELVQEKSRGGPAPVRGKRKAGE